MLLMNSKGITKFCVFISGFLKIAELQKLDLGIKFKDLRWIADGGYNG